VIAKKIFLNESGNIKITFRKLCFALGLLTITSLVVPIEAAPPQKASEVGANATVTPTPTPTATAAPTPHFKSESSNTSGSVTVEGSRVDYLAVAGTIVVHPKGWDDAAPAEDQKTKESEESKNESQDDKEESKNPTAEGSMFYVAYTKQNIEPDKRPIVFLFSTAGPALRASATHGRFWAPTGNQGG
jgi:hypothetical protein